MRLHKTYVKWIKRTIEYRNENLCHSTMDDFPQFKHFKREQYNNRMATWDLSRKRVDRRSTDILQPL